VFGVNSNWLFIGVITDKGFRMFLNSKSVFLMDSKHNVVQTNNIDTMNGLYKFSILHEVFCDFVVSTLF
jgi:hypothetical protein